MPGSWCIDARVQIEVINALNGELCFTLAARPQWPVCRLKTEIANLEGTPVQQQHLLVAGRRLEDSELVGAALAGEIAPYSMTFLRSGVPREDSARKDLVLSIHDSTTCVHWKVDGRKLQKNDRLVVSQPFGLELGDSRRVDFKILIYPHSATTFRQAAGRGRIELKCSQALPEELSGLSFSVAVGNGKRFEASRGPFAHDFAVNGVGRLPEGQQAFDLKAAVDPESSTFVVRLEVSSLGPGARVVH